MSTQRVLFAIVCIGLTLSFLGLVSVRAEEDGVPHVRIVASFYPVYITALNVAGGIPGVTVEDLVPAFAGCLHDYALTTQDMKKLSGADILIVNGAGMESFLENAAARFPRLTIVRL